MNNTAWDISVSEVGSIHDSNERGIKKMFSGTLPKALRTLEKVSQEHVVQKDFKVTYFCVINQLQELLAVSSTKRF
jgi:hypothetical protein